MSSSASSASLRMTPESLQEETVEPGIIRWTLTNPAKRNAIDPAALTYIANRSGRLHGEVVLVQGAPLPDASQSGVFCAGFDLEALRDADPGALPDLPLVRATEAMLDADATFIAVLNGLAIGAGVELASTCDFRIAQDDVRFRVPAGRIGVVYHAQGLRRFVSMFGADLTKRMVLLGEDIGAEAALAAGAVSQMVPPAELDNAALAMARRLRASAPLSLRGNRNLLRRLTKGPITPATLDHHEMAREEAYSSADYGEGRAALREGRPPKFTGR